MGTLWWSSHTWRVVCLPTIVESECSTWAKNSLRSFANMNHGFSATTTNRSACSQCHTNTLKGVPYSKSQSLQAPHSCAQVSECIEASQHCRQGPELRMTHHASVQISNVQGAADSLKRVLVATLLRVNGSSELAKLTGLHMSR